MLAVDRFGVDGRKLIWYIETTSKHSLNIPKAESNMDIDIDRGGRPKSPGEKKLITIRTESESEYKMLLDVPPRMRVVAILEWREKNMAYLLEGDHE